LEGSKLFGREFFTPDRGEDRLPILPCFEVAEAFAEGSAEGLDYGKPGGLMDAAETSLNGL
jgi:hypothetical protein